MKKKNKLIILTIIAVSLVVFTIYHFVIALTYFANPNEFQFMPLIFMVLGLLGLLVVGGIYISLMNSKDKKKIIVDDEDWATKWDMV